MSKKLVKTAKQQFEEKLDSHGLWKEWESQDSCGRVGKVLENGNIVIYIHEEENDKFGEYFYPPFAELRKDDKFFRECLGEYACHSDKDFVCKMVSWLVYGTTECPLFPLDVYFPASHLAYPESHDFEDIYEEVPDEPKVLTAREQWEKDSTGAETVSTLANGSVYKVAVTDGFITFFVYQDGEYFREIYPSFDELRKDAGFVMVYLSHVRCTHDTDMDAALAWLRGSEYTMSKLSLLDIYEIWECIDHLCYHDKEEPAAEVIKQDFKEEIDALRQKMIAHIVELCEQGMTLNVEVLCQNPYLKYKGTCWALTENFNDAWIAKDEQGIWKLFWQDGNPTYEDELGCFSIDTLKDIIEALQ